jgi:DNA-directed RNA polymerase specialized sigma24 family protein
MARNAPAEDRPVHPQTRWSLIARVQTDDPRVRENALNELLAIYYPVMRKFLTAGMGFPPEGADDLIQGFVAEKVLKKNALVDARPARGRFRSFLFKALKNHVLDNLRRQRAQKRSPAVAPVPDTETLRNVPSADASLEDLYNLEWARHTLAEVVRRMRAECEQKRRLELWEIFDGRILQPLLGAQNALPYETLVTRYGFQSPMQASNALITAKRMFRRLLEEVIRDTVETEAQVEAEIRELKRVLSK